MTVVRGPQLALIDALGPSNDAPEAVQIEIRAAALHAGWESANDCDFVIEDPICSNVIEHWIGLDDLLVASVEVEYLARTMQGGPM